MKKISILLIGVLLLISINILHIYAEDSYIELSQNTITLGINNTTILKVNKYGSAKETTTIWQSLNPNIASIENGKITGKKIGTTIIKVISGSYTASCKITVTEDYIPVTGLSLPEHSGEILLNETKKIEPIVTPSNASNKFVLYDIEPEEIATIDKNGVITGKKIGTAILTIRAVSSNNTARYTITVTDKIALKNISTNKTLELKEQSTTKINVTFTPSNATNQKITWKSSDTKIATVDASGNIKALKPGTVDIQAISQDGGHVATCKLTVVAISKKLNGITIDKKDITLNKEETATITVKFNPTYAENQKVTWKSSNTKVATVKDGVITAIKPGNAEITVKTEEGNYEEICKVTVLSPPIESISFENEKETIYLGSETTLKTIIKPTDSVIYEPIWSSSNNEVVSVENGIIKGISLGTATITVQDKEGKIKASTEVTVIEKPKEPLNIKVVGYNLNFNPTTKDYTLKIGSETSLTFEYNIDESKVLIKGNRDLKDGSIITITVTDEEKATYIINIRKKANYTIYFIGVISLLLFLNIIRMLIKNKKKSKK